VPQGFYVNIDFHFEQSGLQNNPTLFASEWRRLWTDLVSLPTYATKLQGALFVELANEWDKFGCRWDTAGGRSESLFTTALSSRLLLGVTLHDLGVERGTALLVFLYAAALLL
jgi:hypothetical protein